MDITHNSEIRRDVSPILLFALTLFSSASLMFVLQPMFGKALLPLLGGSASVWNTCMVFYQSVLFVGYLYAHLLSTRFAYRTHLLLHVSLLLLSLYFLPVSIPEDSRPPAADNPNIWLLTTLLTSIGLPFFILSSNSPLLQKCFSRLGHQASQDPYFLSIASNTGSLIALLSYPFLVEPSIGISTQQKWWSIGFLLLTVLIMLCLSMLKAEHFQPQRATLSRLELAAKPSLKLQLKWLLLAFVPSSLLLGTTNFISIDIATVPLLWVIPLALYLLSFILVFSHYAASLHKKILLLQPWVVAPFLLYYFSSQKLLVFSVELLLHLVVFFISIMICHGELAKKRPATAYLTQYYLIMSFGGMLGGIFNSFIAPVLFNSIYEYPLMIVAALMLNPIQKRTRLYLKAHFARIIFAVYIYIFATVFASNVLAINHTLLIALAALALTALICTMVKKNAVYVPLMGLLVISCTAPEKQQGDQLLHQSRNFYGVLTVKQMTQVDSEQTHSRYHELYSGSTKHGLQIQHDVSKQCTPNGYYSPRGPLGSIFSNFDTRNADWQVGVVGLGAGEMAGYAKKSQHWTFFELDPAVVELAKNPAYFTYLSDCMSGYEVQIGDARITLEQQSQRYNMLVIDAFTSDSIPAHLLTREAIALYFSKLQPDGLLVLHISNRYLNLQKVLADHAEKLGLALLLQEYRPTQNIPFVYRSDWAIIARDEAVLAPLLRENTASGWHKAAPDMATVAWSDDFTSIMPIWK